MSAEDANAVVRQMVAKQAEQSDGGAFCQMSDQGPAPYQVKLSLRGEPGKIHGRGYRLKRKLTHAKLQGRRIDFRSADPGPRKPYPEKSQHSSPADRKIQNGLNAASLDLGVCQRCRDAAHRGKTDQKIVVRLAEHVHGVERVNLE